MQLSAIAAVVVVVTVGVACSDTTSGSSTNATQISVGPGTSFSPKTVTISRGDTIIWVWAGGGHDVTFSTSGAPVNCANMSAGVCIRTFPTAGTFNYFCQPHVGAGMSATVIVQ